MSDLSNSRLMKFAFISAWPEFDQIPDEEMEGHLRAFEQWWGGLDTEAFKRALHEGNEQDRLVALFTLGSLAYEETKEVLAPFLASPAHKERWASAMAFGEHQDERAFALLADLLIDYLEPFSPPADDHKIRQLVDEAKVQARALYNSPAAWECITYPGLVQRWCEMEASYQEYGWYMCHRQKILDILQRWNDPRAIPALRLALQRCWHVEPHTHSFSDTLHLLQDTLAYTLGQLGAWDALEGLETPRLPPSRFKLARMFLIFGLLHVNLGVFHMNLLHMYRGSLTPFIEQGALDPDQVTHVLRERFGLDEYLARANLNIFEQWYLERDERWQWQKKKERGELERE